MFATAIAQLAKAFGEAVPVPATGGAARLDLADPGTLVWPEDARLLERLQQPVADAAVAAAQALRAAAGVDGAVATYADEDAAIAALGQQVRLIEPMAAPVDLQAQVDAARRSGLRVVFDERRTAFRAAVACVARQLARGPDAVLVGRSVAAGLPFAAVIGAVSAVAGAGRSTLQVVAAVVEELLAAPIHAELERAAGAVAAAASAAAREQAIELAWDGPAAMPTLRFAGQEGATPELMRHHFGLELASAGVRADGPLLLPAALLRGGPDAAIAAFRHAIARARTLLIEFNSWLSGGLPYVWRGGDPTLRARGAVIYRYPRQGAVDVGPVGDAMRIAFGRGHLGAVTSSGIYLPTLLQGDVDLAVRYALRRFDSGPDATCLGLFLQNEASTARYYAQVMCTADAPVARSVALGHAGAVIGRTPVDGDEGWLRLVRRGGRVHAFHRAVAAAPWCLLGAVAATGDALIAGAKIWSKVHTDGLTADLFDLEVTAALAAEQPPLLGPSPDPRHAAL